MQEIDTFWLSCLEYFKKELNAQQFNTWIKPLELDTSHNNSTEPILLAPNRFVLQWVKNNFLTHINEMAQQQVSQDVYFRLILIGKLMLIHQVLHHHCDFIHTFILPINLTFYVIL